MTIIDEDMMSADSAQSLSIMMVIPCVANY